jgi:hypothetical protein
MIAKLMSGASHHLQATLKVGFEFSREVLRRD